MLLYENHQNPYGMRKQAIKEFLHDNTTVYIDYDKAEAVKEFALSVMKTGIKPKAAVHVASARY